MDEQVDAWDELVADLQDKRAAWQIAADAADRFRDVICEVLDLDSNPGDDALVEQLRARFSKSGPEPRRWRQRLQDALEEVGIRRP